MNDAKVLSKEEFVELFKQDQERKRKPKIKADLEVKDFRRSGRQKNILNKKRLNRGYY